jgi:hypothetical protein
MHEAMQREEKAMRPNNEDRRETEPPFAELERQLIDAFLAGAGHDYHRLISRSDPEAKRLLADACEYASSRLSEIEARLHYVRSLQGHG